MAKRLAILIAVEKYSDTRINSVQYAEADANGFAAALELAGPIDKVALLSGAATKTAAVSAASIIRLMSRLHRWGFRSRNLAIGAVHRQGSRMNVQTPLGRRAFDVSAAGLGSA